MEHFVGGSTARTVAKYYHEFRELIAKKIENDSPFEGEVELDESCFGGKRKGMRGREAAGKVPVFGILKRGGHVYTHVINDVKEATLMPIITQKPASDSIVYTDTFPSYNALDVNNFHHDRINNSKLFADKKNHINGIENFWNQAKCHLRKFNGIPKENFYLYIKEC